MKKIFYLICILATSTFGARQHMCQYIIKEAYTLLKQALGISIPSIESNLGLSFFSHT